MRVVNASLAAFVPIVSSAAIIVAPIVAPIVVALSFAGGALAQTNGTFLLTSSNTVSPSSPTTTIEIWAAGTRVSGGGGDRLALRGGRVAQ